MSLTSYQGPRKHDSENISMRDIFENFSREGKHPIQGMVYPPATPPGRFRLTKYIDCLMVINHAIVLLNSVLQSSRFHKSLLLCLFQSIRFLCLHLKLCFN